MVDFTNLLDQFVGGKQASGGAGGGGGRSGLAGGSLGGIAGGTLAGGLAGLLMGSKGGRKVAKSAVTYGGVALLGGLAYKAWRDWQSGKAAGQAPPTSADAIEPPPADGRFRPPAEAPAADTQALSQTLLRAMIAAAKADGHIDQDEQRRIFGEVDRLDLGAEEKAFVIEELSRPLDVQAVVAGATCPERAAEIYAASLLAVDPDTPAERAYLSLLAERLGLEPALVDHLHANVGAAVE